MKLPSIKFLLAIGGTIFSTSVFGQVIFQPSLTANVCKKPWSNGSFRFCSGVPVTVPYNQVSSTSSKYLNSLPIENTLSYSLYCPAVPNSTPVYLTTGTVSQGLLASSTAKADRTKTTVSYNALANSSYTFDPKINYDATYAGNCKMEVISNLSIPNVDILRTIVDVVKSNYTDLNDVLATIDEASELPAKWSAIMDAPVTIDGLADSLNNEIAIYQEELDALAATDKSTLSDSDKIRLEQLPGIIELYKGMVNDLTNLKRDIGDVAAIASQCEANVDNAFCLDQVSKISTSIANKLSVRKSELVDINTFLTNESARLKAAALSTSNALLRLVTKFQ